MRNMSSTPEQHEQDAAPQPVPKPEKKSPFSRVYIGPGAKGKLAKFFETHQDVYRKILLFIEQGVYDYVAAEAMGITHYTWQSWLARGERDWRANKKTNYAQFFLDVRTAQSRARVIAELEVKRDDVKFWLTRGPGKTQVGRPGWTETLALAGTEDQPLEVNVNEGDNNMSQVSTIQDLARALLIMEELGLTQRTALLGQSVIDASSHAVQSSDESDEEDTGEDTRSNRGYVPELDSKKDPNNGSERHPTP